MITKFEVGKIYLYEFGKERFLFKTKDILDERQTDVVTVLFATRKHNDISFSLTENPIYSIVEIDTKLTSTLYGANHD